MKNNFIKSKNFQIMNTTKITKEFELLLRSMTIQEIYDTYYDVKSFSIGEGAYADEKGIYYKVFHLQGLPFCSSKVGSYQVDKEWLETHRHIWVKLGDDLPDEEYEEEEEDEEEEEEYEHDEEEKEGMCMYCEIKPNEPMYFMCIGFGYCYSCADCRRKKFLYCDRCDWFLMDGDNIIQNSNECSHMWEKE